LIVPAWLLAIYRLDNKTCVIVESHLMVLHISSELL